MREYCFSNLPSARWKILPLVWIRTQTTSSIRKYANILITMPKYSPPHQKHSDNFLKCHFRNNLCIFWILVRKGRLKNLILPKGVRHRFDVLILEIYQQMRSSIEKGRALRGSGAVWKSSRISASFIADVFAWHVYVSLQPRQWQALVSLCPWPLPFFLKAVFFFPS